MLEMVFISLLVIIIFYIILTIRRFITAQYLYDEGVDALKENNFKDAKNLLKKALKKKPNFFNARQSLYQLHYKLNEFDEAKVCLEKLIKMRPNDFNLTYNMGQLLQKQNEYDEAEKAYRNALKIKGNDYDCIFNLGTIALEQNNYNDSEKYFNKAIEIDSNNTSAFYYLAKSKEALCDPEDEESKKEIQELYAKVESKNDMPADYYISLALNHAKKGNIEQTIENCNKAIDFNPSDSSAYRLLALTYIVQKNKQAAKTNLAFAQQLDSSNEETITLLKYIG